MNYKYSNYDEFKDASNSKVMYECDCENDASVEYRERFWYTLDMYPSFLSKIERQKRMYSGNDIAAGHRLFTLKEIANLKGRIIRRYVSGDREKLDEYLNFDFYYLFVDIDELPGLCDRMLVTYSDMVELVSRYKSDDFPEVYVRPSTSTDNVPCKFHLYIRTKMPYYYRVPAGNGEFRRERECSLVLPEYKMVEKFLTDFRDFFPDYFKNHQFAKVDTALYSIHQCLQSAPNCEIKNVRRSILSNTVLGAIPTKGERKDVFRGVPGAYRNACPYPCNAGMRYKAWGVTLLPVSFDVKLPSEKAMYCDDKVQDGRRKFAQKLARDLWVAVQFNLVHYPEYAEPYDPRRLFDFIMREVYVGANMTTNMNVFKLNKLHEAVKYVIGQMDAESRAVDQIIEDDYAVNVKYDEKGKIVNDYYKIRHPNRTSHQHVYRVIDELKDAGIIKRNRLTVRGAALEKLLAEKHVSRQGLTCHGIKSMLIRKPRCDKGRRRKSRSCWATYIDLCRRDIDNRVVVPVDIGRQPRFRKYCSDHRVQYVSSPLPRDNPLRIDSVTDMPQPSWIEPWQTDIA